VSLLSQSLCWGDNMGRRTQASWPRGYTECPASPAPHRRLSWLSRRGATFERWSQVKFLTRCVLPWKWCMVWKWTDGTVLSVVVSALIIVWVFGNVWYQGRLSVAEMYWWGRFVCGCQCINDNLGVHINMGTPILICPRTCVIMWVGMIVTTVRFPWCTGKRTVSGWW
jgi:hypothetical protein